MPACHYDLERIKFDFTEYIVDCIGPIGTLYIHSGNTLHRNFPIINTQRFVWSQIYTLDAVCVALSENEKSELFGGCKEYLKKLDKNKFKYIELLLNSPIRTSEKYYKLKNNQYFTATKTDLTYRKTF